MKKIGFVFALSVTVLSGCASQLLSDDRLKSNTAGALGTQPEDITISNRREQMPNTYYNAKTKNGEYACIINGGGILAGGMVNPPTCNKI